MEGQKLEYVVGILMEEFGMVRVVGLEEARNDLLEIFAHPAADTSLQDT